MNCLLAFLSGLALGNLIAVTIFRANRRRDERRKVWHNGQPCADQRFHERRK